MKQIEDQPENFAFFITARLAGTIPKYNHSKDSVITDNDKLVNKAAENRKSSKSILDYSLFRKIEESLHSPENKIQYLAEPEIAELVSDSIKFFDGKKFNLIAFTILSNHFHIIAEPISINFIDKERTKKVLNDGSDAEMQQQEGSVTFVEVENIMRSIKDFTENRANELLGRKGEFWENESFDYAVGDKETLLEIIEYILDHPVKAGLCDSPEHYPWNYINENYIEI